MHAAQHYPAPQHHQQQHQQQQQGMLPQRPAMHPHQYSSSSITSVSSAASSSLHTSASEDTATSHSSTSPPDLPGAAQAHLAAAGPGAAGRRRFCCGTCGKDFSTSGHLARHIRVHTGERNHPCPFPGCNARCSRQDNLVQHFRVHMPREERRANSTAVRAELQKCLQSAGQSLNGPSSDSFSSHGATPTPMHPSRGHHGQQRSDSEVPSLPDGGSRSPSPIDSVPLTSPGFGPDAEHHPPWMDGGSGGYPSYNSYVRGPLSSPGAAPNHGPPSPHPTMQLPLPAPTFPYSMPLAHPHQAYHHAHPGQHHAHHHQQPPLGSPTYPQPLQNGQYPPPLSPSSGSGLTSSGTGNSPLTPGWPNTSAIRGTQAPQQQQRTSIRVPVGPASAPAQVVGGASEWPWYGWQGEGKGA
ncbi:hypothetical protein CALCODRAFT_85921 [Calocera cornea HHB12733]|uniref:C2H2-type domain-containing protein n=1 Tax=Calocera cornea HHB12733 TaxID=1353952 RepID=A0A165IPE8_9BASI|nr:hypothetical protein CALCODRAFT_85921 [Calocera cornea HHB12733]